MAIRILTLTNLYPNPYQPHRATFNRQQLRSLADRYPMRIIAPILWTDEHAARRRLGNRLPGPRRVSVDGLTVDHPRYLYTPRMLRGWYGHFFKWSVRPAFRRALDEFRPELVYAPWAYPDGWAAVELGHRAGLPVVVKLHGSDLLTLDRYPGRRRWTIETLRRADGIVAVSRDLADRAIALGADAERVRVVYDGVDARLFHPGSKAEARARLGLDHGDDPILLFVGNLVPIKGVDLLIEACARLRAAGARFACYLIGQGPLQGRLEDRIARTGLSGQVRLLGPRPHDQLPDWFRAADLFALPSHSEGVPIVLLEAAACGTPFVASRVGGIPEIAHLAPSLLVAPGDAEELARAIQDGLTTQRTASAYHPGVSTRSHEAAVSELVGVFEQVLQTSSIGAPSEVSPKARPACQSATSSSR